MRLARPALAVTCLLAFATPASAADTLPLAAKLLAGLVDGGEMVMGSFGKGKIADLGSGAFEVTFEKNTVSFLYDEPDTCIVTQHAQTAGEPASDSRFDVTKLTGIEVRDQGEWEGLHGALITFQGSPEMLQVLLDGKFVNQEPAFAFLASSLTVEELTAAADELQRIC